MKRLLCMLLALILLFTGSAFAAEDLPENTETEETVTEEPERRTAWTPSQAIIEFIANQEGFRSKPHKSGGHWYIGYGTQIKSGQYSDGISREKAMELLMEDVNAYVVRLNNYLAKHGIALTQNQYDALLSLTYNVSTTWMKTEYKLSSYLIKGIENYTDLEFMNAFGSWCKAGGKVLPGLARRRIAEAKIFLYGDYDLFNYTYYYAPDEKDLQLATMLERLEVLDAQLLDGVDEEGNPVDTLLLEGEIEALRLEIQALEAEIEEENATEEPRGPSYPDGVPVDYTYVRYDAGKGYTDTTMIYYRKGEPYQELAFASREGYQLAAWETEDGERILPTDIPTKARAVEAVWSTGEVDHRNITTSLFPDVSIKLWYYDELKELSEQNIIGGYADGKFRPNDSVTCGAALKLVLLTAGYPEQAPTGESSLSGYLTLALQEGLVEEGEITNIKAPASRLLVARLTAKAMGLAASHEATPYADADDAYATALYATGIMEGKDVNGVRILDAAAGIRRCEVAAVVWRMYHYSDAAME